MTIALILGGAVALYFIWFLFRLAVYALPVCTGITIAFALLDRGISYPASIMTGVVGGAFILVSARLLLAVSIAPAARAGVATVFAVPAALAGHAATKAAAGLAGIEGTMLLILSIAGAAATATSSWRNLAGARASVPPQAAVTQERPL